MFHDAGGGVHLVFAPNPYVRTARGGVARRLLFSRSSPPPGPILSPTPSSHAAVPRRPALELTFDPDSIRRDRHHLLGLDARVYGPSARGQESAAAPLAGWFERCFLSDGTSLGRSPGISPTGFILFPRKPRSEAASWRALQQRIRRKYGGLQLDSAIRYCATSSIWGSSTRGRIRRIDRGHREEKLTFANAVGLRLFHALLIDEFQLDAWFGVGWSSKELFDRRPLAIRQAF